VFDNLEYHPDKEEHYSTCYTQHKVFFEVKTTIPSLGELIRQIRMYQEYENGIWVVVSPDDTHSSRLEKQGIKFIKYEPELFIQDTYIGRDGIEKEIPIS
jgi:hypothetical protein